MHEETTCFWCGDRPGASAQPGKIALCCDCEAELSSKASLVAPAATAAPDDGG